MAPQSENPVSPELGRLLELLNAHEAQDSRPLENFATLERRLAAGKTGPTESSFDDHQSEAGGGISDAAPATFPSVVDISRVPSWLRVAVRETESRFRF